MHSQTLIFVTEVVNYIFLISPQGQRLCLSLISLSLKTKLGFIYQAWIFVELQTELRWE